MKRIESPLFRTAKCEVISVEANLPLFVCIGDLRVHYWSAMVENVAVNIQLVRRSSIAVFVYSSRRAKGRPVAFSTTGHYIHEEVC